VWKEDCKWYGSFSESDLKTIEETASCAISIHSSFLTIRAVFRPEKSIRGEPVESCKLRYFNSFEFFDHTGVQEYENGRAQRELAALQFKAAAHGFRLVNVQNPA
jgi:hypothetical protein